MSHTYASIEDFKRFMIDGGDSSWSASDAIILTILEGASRRVDGFTMRSQFGSGFGPRIGTNKYDYPASTVLDLRDDLLTVTSFTAHDVYGDTGRTLTESTHYIKRPSVAPARTVELLYASAQVYGLAQDGNAIVGTWGYSDESYALGTGGTVTSSGTSLIVSGGTAYAGQTLLVDSEQMYVTASGGTATVVRAVNGTTAAVHAAGAAISAYRYDRAAVSATLQIGQRRFRSAQSGLQGDFGGGGLPIVGHRDTEYSILKGTVGHLKIWSAG